jgi:hypothetical protein
VVEEVKHGLAVAAGGQYTPKRAPKGESFLQESEMKMAMPKKVAANKKPAKTSKKAHSKQNAKQIRAARVQAAHMHVQTALKSHAKKTGMNKAALTKARDAVKKINAGIHQAKAMKVDTSKADEKAAKAAKNAAALKRRVEQAAKAAKKARTVSKGSKKKARKKLKVFQKAKEAIAKQKAKKSSSWGIKPLQEHVRHWDSEVKRTRKAVKEAEQKREKAYLSSSEHRRKKKKIVVEEVKHGLAVAAGGQYTPKRAPKGESFLQESEVSDTQASASMEAQASEISSKAFKWEQRKRDMAFAKRAQEESDLEKAKALREFKRIRTVEIYNKQKSRRSAAARATRRARKKASWEIAAKAYNYVDAADADSH